MFAFAILYYVIINNKLGYPCKKLDKILMTIRCYFSSQLDLVTVWSKSTPNSTTIPWHLSRFYLFFMLENDMTFGRGQVMEFPWHLLRKWRDFPWRFGLTFEPNQTAVKKTWENPCHIFHRVIHAKPHFYFVCTLLTYKM